MSREMLCLLLSSVVDAPVIAGSRVPEELGGVHKTISRQPAIVAGIASINMEENKGAVPPGM